MAPALFSNAFIAQPSSVISERLVSPLESRLDVIVYRAKFVTTLFAARQLVNHGHVRVNGKRVTVPSYRCKPGDVVSLRVASRRLAAAFLEAVQSSERGLPDYLDVDYDKMSATYRPGPALADVPYPAQVEPRRDPQVKQGRSRRARRREAGTTPTRPVGGRERRELILQALSASFEGVLKQELPGLTENSDNKLAEIASVLGEHITDILAGRSVILKLNRELDSASRGAIETFLKSVFKATENLDSARHEAAIAKLAEVMLPDPLMEARGALALDNLKLRDRFVAEEAVLTSLDVGERSGHQSGNPYATAARWKKAGMIFSINHRGAEYFPAFQFRDGRPHPAIAKVLATLPRKLTPWQIAFWFVSTNGWLDGDAPKDRLEDVGKVVAAAEREGEEVMG
jgi:ribosomal 50S subunit-recycling heat shock protein